MRVLLINSVVGKGSTGTIVAGIYQYLRSKGDDVRVGYGIGASKVVPASDTYKVNDWIGYYFHNLISHFTDKAGFYSRMQTKRFIRFIREFNPDVINIHNLHGYWIDIRTLFMFLQHSNCRVIWTLHDCWSFTGHCAHFDLLNCFKWRDGCNNCPGLGSYPVSWLMDHSRINYDEKKSLFLSLGDRLVLVPVSEWLSALLSESFFKRTKIIPIHNGINLSLFKPVCGDDLVSKFGLNGCKILLGVASPWSRYKGLLDFYRLRGLLPKDFVIVLIGLSEPQIKQLPLGILGLSQITQSDLVKWYSLADVFINPTYSDTYPTVNLESISCGTPVITYNTGGSPESLSPDIGYVVQRGDVSSIADAVYFFCSQDRLKVRQVAFNYSRALFGDKRCFDHYYKLMHSTINQASFDMDTVGN